LAGTGAPTTSTKPFVHGSCLTTNNQCASGTLLDTIDSSIEYLWTCEGSGGGMSSYCKTLKPAYEIPPSILNPKTTTNQPVFNRPLALGQEGEDVKQLQKFLNNNGYIIKSEGVGSPGQETNYFGFATEGALKRFQCAVLKICSGGSYGVLDQTTINAIKNKTPTKILPSQNLGGQAKYTFTKTLKLGQKGEDVKQLQKFLNNNGFPVASTGPGSKGNETTTFGPATQRAVIKFQEAYAKDVLTPSGLKKGTGTFGPATLKKVNGMVK
jgi:peptidoglycan hydrolase-like protein with peptidoglycan-binding domain